MESKEVLIAVTTGVLLLAGFAAMLQPASAPLTSRADPHTKFSFLVEIDGIPVAEFAEVSGLSVDIEVMEFREGGDAGKLRLIPGLARYGPITLKRGFLLERSFADWIQDVVDGEITRRSGVVILLNQRREEVARFGFTEAWPSSWSLGSLDAEVSEVLLEEVTLQVEGIQWLGE